MASSGLPFTMPLWAPRLVFRGVSISAAQGFGFRFINFLAKTGLKDMGLIILFLHT